MPRRSVRISRISYLGDRCPARGRSAIGSAHRTDADGAGRQRSGGGPVGSCRDPGTDGGRPRRPCPASAGQRGCERDPRAPASRRSRGNWPTRARGAIPRTTPTSIALRRTRWSAAQAAARSEPLVGGVRRGQRRPIPPMPRSSRWSPTGRPPSPACASASRSCRAIWTS